MSAEQDVCISESITHKDITSQLESNQYKFDTNPEAESPRKKAQKNPQ